MRAGIRSGGVVLWVALGVASLATSPGVATAASRGQECRATCASSIARCVGQGYRPRFCVREVLSLCKKGRVECDATPSTTLPVCVTVTTTTTTSTTTLPDQSQNLGPAGCDVTPTGVTGKVSTADELRQRLLGVWFDCKTPGTYAPDSDGIEFTADGHFYFLELKHDRLVRQTGFGQAGTYEIIDTTLVNGPGVFQLNMNLNTGYLQILLWSFAERPRLLRVDNNGFTSTLYSHMPVGAP